MRDHFVTKTAVTTNKGVPGYDPWTPLSCDSEVEPTDGFEPSTCGLRNRCSTTELRWQFPVYRLVQDCY